MQDDRHWTTRLADGLAARRTAFARPASAFAGVPEPLGLGSAARGRQILRGRLRLADGALDVPPEATPWEVAPPSAAFATALHGFAWLDDLAAVPVPAARVQGQAWTAEWMRRHGRGAGWRALPTARRVVRWIDHAAWLLAGRGAEGEAAHLRSLTRQVHFLARRWRSVPPGPARIEALSGLVYAALSLDGMERAAVAATEALGAQCARLIGPNGGLPSRRPEQLLDVFVQVARAADALEGAAWPVPHEIAEALGRMAPALRALRHADGGLARFHGGGAGAPGRLDAALAGRPRPRGAGQANAMGFMRLAAGRTTLLLDAAAPPEGPAARHAHASTLAFEITSGRRPLIVSCGPGASFGAQWQRAGRATASHSVLGLTGISAGHLADPAGRQPPDAPLVAGPREVRRQRLTAPDAIGGRGAISVQVSHDAWRRSHGLTYGREIDLSLDGRVLRGEETLAAVTDDDTALFERALAAAPQGGLPYAVRFHLHPTAEVAVDVEQSTATVALASGEAWSLRHDGVADLLEEPSVYLDPDHPAPRAARQLVLAGWLLDPVTRVRWQLEKAEGVPDALRDVPAPQEEDWR